MAKVRNPLLSAEASGSAGGITFSSFRGIATARVKSFPVQRYSNVMPYNRSVIGYLSRLWGSIGATNRELWKQWAREHPQPDGFGGRFQMAGINAFTQLNARRLMIDSALAYVSTPPVTELAVGMKELIAGGAVGTGSIVVTWTRLGTGNSADYHDIGLAGPFASPGMFEVRGQFRRASVVAGTFLTKTLTGLQANAWYWVSVRYVKADGQVSVPLIYQCQA